MVRSPSSIVRDIIEELDRRRAVLVGKRLGPKLDAWATELATLWGDEATTLLIQRYGRWVREVGLGEDELDADQLSAAREEFLRTRTDDPMLNMFDKVRFALEEIACKYKDSDFLDQVDNDLIPRWKELEPERLFLKGKTGSS